MARISILVASSGRLTLSAALRSFASQMRPGDELLVDVNDDAPWGHKARNRLMPRAKGDVLLFVDDDDQLVDGALFTVRRALDANPARVHLFRMRYADGSTLWADREVREGNVSTQMVVVPNVWATPTWSLYGANAFLRLGASSGWLLSTKWGERYAGDFDFIESVVKMLGEPVWHEEVIALVRP